MPQAVSYRPPADNSLVPLSEQASERAGLTVYMLRVDTLTDQFTTAAAVGAHLNRRPHPGVPSPLVQVAATLGPDAARRYKIADHSLSAQGDGDRQAYVGGSGPARRARCHPRKWSGGRAFSRAVPPANR